MTPFESTAMPSAELVVRPLPRGSFSGSGMKYLMEPFGPSFTLPTRMPRVQSVRAGATEPDSESAA